MDKIFLVLSQYSTEITQQRPSLDLSTITFHVDSNTTQVCDKLL